MLTQYHWPPVSVSCDWMVVSATLPHTDPLQATNGGNPDQDFKFRLMIQLVIVLRISSLVTFLLCRITRCVFRGLWDFSTILFACWKYQDDNLYFKTTKNSYIAWALKDSNRFTWCMYLISSFINDTFIVAAHCMVITNCTNCRWMSSTAYYQS